MLCNNLRSGLWGWLELACARDNFLKTLCWEEAWLLTCLDLDGLASERVTTLTCLAIHLLEFTEIIDHHIFALGDCASDCVEDDIYSVSCFFFAVVEVWGQRGNELGLVHENPLIFTRKS